MHISSRYFSTVVDMNHRWWSINHLIWIAATKTQKLMIMLRKWIYIKSINKIAIIQSIPACSYGCRINDSYADRHGISVGRHHTGACQDPWYGHSANDAHHWRYGRSCIHIEHHHIHYQISLSLSCHRHHSTQSCPQLSKSESRAWIQKIPLTRT